MIITLPAKQVVDPTNMARQAVHFALHAIRSALDCMADQGMLPEEILAQRYAWVGSLRKMMRAERTGLEGLLFGDLEWLATADTDQLTSMVLLGLEDLLKQPGVEHRLYPWDAYTRLVHIPDEADEALYTIRLARVLGIDSVMEIK